MPEVLGSVLDFQRIEVRELTCLQFNDAIPQPRNLRASASRAPGTWDYRDEANPRVNRQGEIDKSAERSEGPGHEISLCVKFCHAQRSKVKYHSPAISEHHKTITPQFHILNVQSLRKPLAWCVRPPS